MEYGLWLGSYFGDMRKNSLNPCSNGIWSLTFIVDNFIRQERVLILVLMEYGLWHI